MIGTELAMALDPARFAVQCGIPPDDWQASVLRSTASQLLLNCSRQSGKSTTVALAGLHRALFWPGSLVLLVTPSLRQSQELFRKVIAGFEALGRPVDPEAESTLRLELPGGSRIAALPGKEQTIRGYSGVDLLILDEAARVLDSTYRALRPMLAVSGGRLLALSTPAGRRGWFFEAWDHGESWQRFEIKATECPRISPEFLESERASLPRSWFEQEYLCQFNEAEGAVFMHEDVMAAVSGDVLPLFTSSQLVSTRSWR